MLIYTHFSGFRDILNFLREGELPQRDRVRAVHREAQYYAIGPLLESLEDTQPLTGEKVRQAFLDLLPYYKGKIKIIRGVTIHSCHNSVRYTIMISRYGTLTIL